MISIEQEVEIVRVEEKPKNVPWKRPKSRFKQNPSMTGYYVLAVVQFIFLALLWIFTHYDKSSLPADPASPDTNIPYIILHPHFQDIQVMIFIGFGFLMTFLRKYGYSATGYTLFLASLVAQWTILVKGFIYMVDGKILVSLESIIDADLAAAVPLISMGALLGKTTPIQLLIMAMIEVVFFAANEYLVIQIFGICDVGGSITVHAFGAYFGLAVSLMLIPPKEENEHNKFEGANYTSDVFAMIGCLFLWVYWPSFNSVLAAGTGQERAIINTYLSLTAATVSTFIVSAIVSEDNKINIVHVQNATLAGGVAAGTVCNLLLGPYGAVLIGILAGTTSVLGFQYVMPFLNSIRLQDTCGVHNLHGIPSVLSAIVSAVYAALATKEAYKSDLASIFPAMMSESEMLALNNNTLTNNYLGGYDRTAGAQAGYQLLGLAVTCGIALASGVLTGIVLKYANMRQLKKEEYHQDELYWELPKCHEE